MTGIALHCTTCQDAFRVLATQAGKKVRCPHCGAVNHVAPRDFEPPPLETSDEAASHERTQSNDRSAAIASPLNLLADTVRRSGESAANRQDHPSRIRYTHSALARTADFIGKLLLVVAMVVQAYIFIMTDWKDFKVLPFQLAVPAFAECLVPAGLIGLTAILLLLAAHAVEYLARIAAARREM